MATLIRCRDCGTALSTALEREVDRASTQSANGQPFVQRGSVHLSDGGFFVGTQGRYIIHPEDRSNLRPHAERRRHVGCCGPAGRDGVNQVCACGAEVATEKSDCWMPHALIFELDAVDLVDDGS